MKLKKKRGLWVLFISAACAFLLVFPLSACASNGESNSTGENTEGAQVIHKGESLEIPVNALSETAKFYYVTVDSTRMGVVAVKLPDGEIRTAFDTCQVCNGSPYAYFEQVADTLQCQNCGNQFPMEHVEVKAGGCNPVPIFEQDKTTTDESITISYDTLLANKDLFPANWRTEHEK